MKDNSQDTHSYYIIKENLSSRFFRRITRDFIKKKKKLAIVGQKNIMKIGKNILQSYQYYAWEKQILLKSSIVGFTEPGRWPKEAKKLSFPLQSDDNQFRVTLQNKGREIKFLGKEDCSNSCQSFDTVVLYKEDCISYIAKVKRGMQDKEQKKKR